jgi:hypothetical protein
VSADLDRGARLSYAREEDTRSEALSRPILAAPTNWRGWADMRARIQASQNAARAAEPQRQSRAERAARRTARSDDGN